MLDGALKLIVACVLVATAVTPVGAPGTVAGVTEFDALEGVLVPTAFIATTVKEYAVPFARPVIVIGEEPPLAVNPPTLEVTA